MKNISKLSIIAFTSEEYMLEEGEKAGDTDLRSAFSYIFVK